jgi:type VII secretion-associated serine protease mycosin
LVPTAAIGDSIRDQEWFLSALDVAPAHDISKGKGITVAIIDTGVQAAHPDLVGKILSGADLTAGTGNGQTDVVGHGTAMASLIVGHGHGKGATAGVVGIAPLAAVLPIRSNVGAITTSSGVAEGIRWALAHQARVICLAEGDTTGTRQLKDAIMAAEAADVVVVAAAGNRPGPNEVEYPAAYPGVIAAGGTDEHENHAAVSVSGPQIVLAAPATNIVTADIDGGYGIGSGTSSSTAIIAGAAALVRSRFPNLSAAEVVHRLTATAIDKGPPGRDDEYGYGELNLVGALTANVPPLATGSSSSTDSKTTPTGTRSSHPTAEGSKSSSHNWLPLIAGLVALIAVLAVWIAARRRT